MAYAGWLFVGAFLLTFLPCQLYLILETHLYFDSGLIFTTKPLKAIWVLFPPTHI